MLRVSDSLSANMKALTSPKAATPKRLAENATFLRLYAACLSGATSQLEQICHDADGTFQGDVFDSDDDDNLARRERFIARRCFRLAVFALEELEVASFNQSV